MSSTMQLSNFERSRPPIRLAAGPDNMVSTGRSLATEMLIIDPSPLNTMI